MLALTPLQLRVVYQAYHTNTLPILGFGYVEIDPESGLVFRTFAQGKLCRDYALILHEGCVIVVCYVDPDD